MIYNHLIFNIKHNMEKKQIKAVFTEDIANVIGKK